MKNSTLVLGTSLKSHRYSNMAVKRLRAKGISVKAFGLRSGTIADVQIDNRLKDYDDIDTITLYLNPNLQQQYYEYILSLDPNRVIFNPGTENSELIALLQKHNIIPEVACTLVLLSTGQY